jgi:hypothetical protein
MNLLFADGEGKADSSLRCATVRNDKKLKMDRQAPAGSFSPHGFVP